MMLSSLVMLILAILLYNIFNEVNSAGVPNVKYFPKFTLTEENTVVPKTQLEYLNQFEYKFETLTRVINKMDNSLQELQEKSNTWAIFQHHINAWNEGIRILENKLDLLKRSHEEQQQQLEKLELVIGSNNQEVLFQEIKQILQTEHKNKNDISSKLNNILRHLQIPSAGNSERKSHKMANIMAPIIPTHSSSNLCSNITNRLELQLNHMAHQMALQKDLKQLNSLEKRNSKSLENILHTLNNHSDKQDEITARIQRSNECCYSLSSEVTTFTESSDILLKRIEKLVRNVNEKLNSLEEKSAEKDGDGNHDDEQEENESVEGEDDKQESLSNEDVDLKIGIGKEQHDLELEVSTRINNSLGDIDDMSTDVYEYDYNHDVELIKPQLNGCHELLSDLNDDDLDDESTRVDGIYKFGIPDINEDGRNFNERYCVFPNADNDTKGIPWTVIQRRGPYPQQESFNRSWSEYRNGFGHLSRDFWFGNEFIHRLVYNDDYELRIELEDFEGNQKWAEYSVFRIDSEKYNYNLLIGEYHGTVEDAMKYHNDNDFSTYDRRNDKTVDACCSCAMGYASGWWFDNCSEANLNGIYHFTPLNHNYIGVIWELWRGDYSLKKTRMMIRPRTKNEQDTVRLFQDYHEYTEDP